MYRGSKDRAMNGDQRLGALGILATAAVIGLFVHSCNESSVAKNEANNESQQARTQACEDEGRDPSECILMMEMIDSCENIGNDTDEANCMQNVYVKTEAAQDAQEDD